MQFEHAVSSKWRNKYDICKTPSFETLSSVSNYTIIAVATQHESLHGQFITPSILLPLKLKSFSHTMLIWISISDAVWWKIWFSSDKNSFSLNYIAFNQFIMTLSHFQKYFARTCWWFCVNTINVQDTVKYDANELDFTQFNRNTFFSHLICFSIIFYIFRNDTTVYTTSNTINFYCQKFVYVCRFVILINTYK